MRPIKGLLIALLAIVTLSGCLKKPDTITTPEQEAQWNELQTRLWTRPARVAGMGTCILSPTGDAATRKRIMDGLAAAETRMNAGADEQEVARLLVSAMQDDAQALLMQEALATANDGMQYLELYYGSRMGALKSAYGELIGGCRLGLALKKG